MSLERRAAAKIGPVEPARVAGETGRVVRAVRTYLSERFPIVSQGGTVLSAFACCYLLYGQAGGEQVFQWTTVVGGLTVVLLALIRRIVDDIEDLRDDISTGRASFADGTRQLHGLIVGAVTATVLVGALNATGTLVLAGVGVGIAMWFGLATVIKHLVARWRTLRFIVNETCPATILLYSYAVWHEVAHRSLPTITVVAAVGLFWTTYQFWNFTRKVGKEGWPPWEMSLKETRPALIVLLTLAAACDVLIAHYAHLHLAYLIYGVILSVVFAAIILRWWSRLPALEPTRVGASWGGLPFALGVEAGVLLAVLMASV
jgi:hypothetical protein